MRLLGHQLTLSARTEMTSTEGTHLPESPTPEIPNDDKEEIAAPLAPVPVTGKPLHNKCTFFIEPAVLLLVFGLNLSGTIFKNQIIYQTCTSVFLYDASICGLLGTANSTPESKQIETEVQPYAAKIFMTKVILESVVPAVGGLFFGGWSDKNGRKPLLVASFVGYSLIYIITSIICFLSKTYLINPWYYILSVVPESILGGNCIYRIAIFCYIADITTAEQRPIRMAFLEASIYIGLMAGSFAASYIYAVTSTFAVFTISATLIVTSTLYIVFYVPESLKQRKDWPDESNTAPAFTGNPIGEMLKTCFKPRENYARLIVWLIITILFISVFVINGTSTVFYLFVREKFQWTVRDFTIYEAFATLVPILGNIVGMLVMRKILNVSVTSLALLAIASSMLSTLAKGLASAPWHIYLSVGLGGFKAVGNPMCRSILSNIVPGTDLGKIFAFANVLDSVAPFAATTLYTFLYSSTLSTYPGVFSLLSSGLYLISFMFLVIIFGIKHSSPGQYATLL